jgi:hypothetical protein
MTALDLDALEKNANWILETHNGPSHGALRSWATTALELIQRLRAAEKQSEPVAWSIRMREGNKPGMIFDTEQDAIIAAKTLSNFPGQFHAFPLFDRQIPIEMESAGFFLFSESTKEWMQVTEKVAGQHGGIELFGKTDTVIAQQRGEKV